MKKYLKTAVPMLCVAVAVLTGCGSREAETTPSVSIEASASEEKTVSIHKEYSTQGLLNIIGYAPSKYVTLPKNYKSLHVSYNSDAEVEGDPALLAVTQKLEKSCKYHIPYSLVSKQVEEQLSMSKKYAKNLGMSYQKYIQTFGCKTEEEFKKYTQKNIRESLKQQLCQQAVIEVEGITVSDEDFTEWQKDHDSGVSPEEMISSMGLNQAVLSCAEDKAMETIKSAASLYDTAE